VLLGFAASQGSGPADQGNPDGREDPYHKIQPLRWPPGD
jgi:hypothetical protein